MEKLDLDLDNYSFEELLSLFKLHQESTPEDVTRARRIVLRTHPDKSQLDPKYYVFFSNAYKLVAHVFSVKHAQTKKRFDLETDKDREKAARTLTETKQFQKQFNDLFEKYYVKEDDGHGEWFKSREDLDVPFEQRKRESRAIIAPVENYAGSTFGTALDGPSTSAYSDLKQIYTTDSVIGVSEEDLKVRYRNLEELRAERAARIEPMTREEGERFEARRSEVQNGGDLRRAFQLAKQHEKGLAQTNQFWGNLLRLT
jgi:hypothetical protein